MIKPIVDVSKWQDDINVETLLAKGTRGLYMKAGGVWWKTHYMFPDPWYERNYTKFKSKLPIGAYFWFVPGTNGAAQAMYCYEHLLKGKEFELPLAVDVEENLSNTGQGDFRRELKAFLNVIEKQAGIKPVIYTRASFWNQHVGNVDWASDHRLWVAFYNDYVDHPWNFPFGERYRPLPWKEYWLWQHTDKGIGPAYGTLPYKSKQIDLNRCSMTEAEWSALTKGDYIPPEPTPEPLPETVTIKAPWGLRLRNTPTTQGSRIDAVLMNGTNVNVLDEDGDWLQVNLGGWVHKNYVR